ncbi:hypothetical protein [Actinomadura sp. NPDC048394]|jgi:hypothetical protein|uniref:hypothetical protein n=1 Tax=Actinomadura sp. NPDC048394 TaxID=3158223 RepID=UPI0034041A7B
MIDVNLAMVFLVLGAGAVLTVLISGFLGWAMRARAGSAAPAPGVHRTREDERQPVS